MDGSHRAGSQQHWGARGARAGAARPPHTQQPFPPGADGRVGPGPERGWGTLPACMASPNGLAAGRARPPLTPTRRPRARPRLPNLTTPPAMATAYLRDFVESVADLPAELQRTFALMRELDASAAALQASADAAARTCLLGPGASRVRGVWRGLRGMAGGLGGWGGGGRADRHRHGPTRLRLRAAPPAPPPPAARHPPTTHPPPSPTVSPSPRALRWRQPTARPGPRRPPSKSCAPRWPSSRRCARRWTPT